MRVSYLLFIWAIIISKNSNSQQASTNLHDAKSVSLRIIPDRDLGIDTFTVFLYKNIFISKAPDSSIVLSSVADAKGSVFQFEDVPEPGYIVLLGKSGNQNLPVRLLSEYIVEPGDEVT